MPDIGNASIRRIHDGSVETLVGAEEGTFKYPMDIAWAPDRTLLIADAGTHEIRTWSPTSGLGTLTTQSDLHTPHGVAAGPTARSTSRTWTPTRWWRSTRRVR